jgi:hypothetical protein
MKASWLCAITAGACLGFWLPPAPAQYARKLEGLLDRPSTLSPSQTIGGTYTYGTVRPLASTRGNNVALFSQRGLPQRRDLRDGHFTAALSYSQLGIQDDAGALGRGSFFDLMRAATRDRSGDISVISGLNGAMNLNIPLPNSSIGQVPSLSACAYTPRAVTTRFDDLLGLRPAEPATAAVELPSLAERLDARTGDVASWAEREGLALFKEGTQEVRDSQTGLLEKCPDCPDKLARAVQRLRMASDLNRASALPPLLMAHAALEQERPLMASNELLRALRRDPQAFATARENFDRYFGDVEGEGGRSMFLAAQMRRYVRMGDYKENENSPFAFALEAYCAWRLGEVGVARAALDRLDELATSGGEGEAEALHGFAAALRMELR